MGISTYQTILFHFYSYCFLLDFSECKSDFNQHLSYSSLTNIDFCLDPRVFPLFCCLFLFPRYIASSFLSWPFDVLRVIKVYFPFKSPYFFYICTKFQTADWEHNHLPLHTTVDYLLEWAFLSFPTFQFNVLSDVPCYLSIKHSKWHVEVWKKYFLTVDWFAYLPVSWLVSWLILWHINLCRLSNAKPSLFK